MFPQSQTDATIWQKLKCYSHELSIHYNTSIKHSQPKYRLILWPQCITILRSSDYNTCYSSLIISPFKVKIIIANVTFRILNSRYSRVFVRRFYDSWTFRLAPWGAHSYFNFLYLRLLNGAGKSHKSSLSHIQSLQFKFYFADESQVI